jgi:multidrug efflux system membrane fusion protein
VLSGIVPGDRIVIDGADKLRDGAKINVRSEADSAKPADATTAADPNKTGDPDKSGGGKKRRSDNGQKQ